MRISDWSSDVCSSDLRLAEHRCCDLCFLVALRGLFCESGNALFEAFEVGQQQFGLDRLGIGDGIDLVLDMLDVVILETAQDMDDRIDRSEEHTSELQSLMRISYAVFCLKKKKLKKAII